MGAVWQDAKFGLHVLKRNPGFAATAVLTLALGVGVNTAIFSVMIAVLLRPFSYPDPGRLVAIHAVNPPDRVNPISVSFTKFTQIKEQRQSVEATAAYHSFNPSLATNPEAELVAAARVSPDFFPISGATPTRGRSFLPQEDQPGGADVVVIGDGFWHSHFGADPELVVVTR